MSGPSAKPFAGRAGLTACMAAEIVAGALGFVATIHLARRLGPPGFATMEVAMAASGWLLVLVRGGLDQIVIREAARHPRLIEPLTRLLIRLRLVWAVIGLTILAAVAARIGPEQARIVLAGGLILLASAVVRDVGPRARGELGFLATLQVLRGIGLIAAVFGMVAGPDHLLFAATAPAIAESVVAAACFAQGLPSGRQRPFTSRRSSSHAAIVFSRRAAVAGMTRFIRVGLYAADALVLGLVVDAQKGEYAAARRVVFALVSVGLVIPALLQPALARARSKDGVSRELGRGLGRLLVIFVPAAVGLIAIADRFLPGLFGSDYGGGLVVVALTATRLPVLLAATWFQSALVARSHEALLLKQMAVIGLVAAIALPIAGQSFGVVGIGSAMIGMEVLAALGGWFALTRLGYEPGRGVEPRPIAVGCLAMVATVALTRAAPLAISVGLGAAVYGAAWLGSRRSTSRGTEPGRYGQLALEGRSR